MKTRLSRERGVTLIELLVTVSIMGIAFVALVSGMITAQITSDYHRKQATAQTELRTFAEAIKLDTYVACPATNQATSYGTAYTAPTGYTKSITTVEYYAADVTDPAVAVFQGTCSTADQGLQRLTIRISSTDNRAAETLVFLKRCAGARPSPCP